jgi:MFS family permease
LYIVASRRPTVPEQLVLLISLHCGWWWKPFREVRDPGHLLHQEHHESVTTRALSMMDLGSFRQRTFASLAICNYRLFFIGQAISLSDSWKQRVAQGLLVLELTGSGTALGLVTALQALPVLLFGAWGGVLAGRLPKRSILYVAQSVSGLLSLLMCALIIAGVIELWMVYVLAVLLGFIKVFDNPTRQTFVREMVGGNRLTNAISLNSTELNLARVIGPSIAGILVATVGLGACFVVDGLSYSIVIIMLLRMRADELMPAVRVARAKGQLVEGLHYV